MGRRKKQLGTHPITKKPLYKKDVDNISKSLLDIKKDLEKRFPNVHKLTLTHLAMAISLTYPIFVTENTDLLDDKEYLKDKYNIQVGQMWEFTNIEDGAVI